MAGEQQFKVYLSFRDEATGKFIKATEDQISSMKKLGLAIKKEGNAAAVDLDKMAVSHEKAGRAGRFHRTTITELQGSIGSLRNMLLLYFFAMRPIMNMYKNMTEAAMAQENAEMRLGAAFAATGRGTKESIVNIRELASEMQNLTGYDDDQIISAAGILATYKLNESQIKRTIPTLLDMTSALKAGGDANANLEAVAKRLGLAFTGQATYLKRYGIVIDETTAKSGTFSQILSAIQSSVGGAAAVMGKTYAGQVNILKAAIGDLSEALGNIVIKAPMVVASLQSITDVIKGMTGDVNASREATDTFAQTWDRIVAAIIGVVNAIKFVWQGLLEGIRAVLIVTLEVHAWFVNLHIQILEVARDLALLTPLTKSFAQSYQQSINDLKVTRDTSSEMAKGLEKDFMATADAMTHTFDTMVDQYDNVKKKAEDVVKSQAEGIKGLKDAAEDAAATLGNTFNSVTTFMTAAVAGMRDAMVDGFFKTIHGEFESLGDTVKAFGDMMLKTLLQIGTNMLLIKAGLGSYLGFAGGLAHTGGYIYANNVSYGMPRRKFHSGGEVPATLLEGEYVLNRNAVRNVGVSNLDKLNRGESSTGGTVINNYYIQTIDERSFRERLQEHGDIYEGAADMGIRDNRQIRRTSQRWG